MKKTFNAVAWMRKRRTEIDEEDQRLSWEEKRKKTRRILEKDSLWLKLKSRVVETTAISAGILRKYKRGNNEKTV
jgi:hypothetical protein